MKFLISLFWGFIFSFISIFIVSSILGSNGISKGLSVINCAILAVVFTIFITLLDFITKQKNK